MIEVRRGLSFVAYSYEGGPLRFTVTFPYLKREHVEVYVGNDLPRYVSPTWVNSTTIEIPDQSEHLTPPMLVQVRRRTPIAEAAITFQNGATLPAAQLNTAVRQLLYRQQEVGEQGLDGNGLPSGGIPGGNMEGINPDFRDIQTIIDAVMQSPAFAAATQRIDLTDRVAETLLEELLRSDSFLEEHRITGGKITEAVHRISLVETQTGVMAEEYTSLVAALQEDMRASYTEINRALVEETEARVLAASQLYATLNDKFTAEVNDIRLAVATDKEAYAAQMVDLEASLRDDLTANYREFNEALANENEAWSQAMQAVRADMTTATGDLEAQVIRLDKAIVDGDSAQATALTTHIAAFNANKASVSSEIATKATPTEAKALAEETVRVFAGSQFAALQETFDAFVSEEEGKWDATWSIRVNGGDPANPVVSGIALGATANGSDFVVNADRFAITSADAYGNRKFPFVVGTVGGVSTVGITGSLLVDGSITTNKLKVNTLSAITANAGTINGGTFKTHTLDANGNVVDSLEFRAEMTNVGNWPLWVGTGVKNENNAIFWVDRTGRAGFAGEISAPNIRGNFQSIVPVMWRGSINLGTVSAEVCRFTLPAPVLQGQAHIPVLILSAGVDHIMTDNGRANILIERLEGASFVTVDDYFIIQGDGRKMNHALHFVDAATTAEQTYRVLVKDSNNGDKMNITKVSGLAMGIR